MGRMGTRFRQVMVCIAIVGAALASGGCRRGGGRYVNVVGSTSVQPFAEMLAQEFNERNPGAAVEVQGGGSTFGLQVLAGGMADIAMCSRRLKPAEKFTPITIARDGIAVVVHPSNPVSDLSLARVRDLFSGGAANWRDVDGLDRPVRLITREEGSGTREAFADMVMNKERIARTALTQESNGAVRELVSHDPCAIGYMSLGLVGKDLKALRIDDVAPTHESVMKGAYPLVRPFLFVVKDKPGEASRPFIEFVLSDHGQRMLEKEGLVRAK